MLLHILGISAFVISSIILGFYLRSLHFERIARDLSDSLDETQTAFYVFQEEAEMTHNDLIAEAAQMYENLNEEQTRAQREIADRESIHNDTLTDIWETIDELEIRIREFEEKRQETVSNLGARSIIPPIAGLVSQMERSQENLRESLESGIDSNPEEEETRPVFRTMALSAQPQSVVEAERLLDKLDVLMTELDMQQQLLDNLNDYKERMSPYLLNYPTIWPVTGQISSGFGWRNNPIGRGNEYHYGIDIPARSGTPIRAAGGGTVTFAGWNSGYGNTIIIDHGSGITTMYAHNSSNNVTEGQRVERGDIIAYVGSTGRSTGPHVHYEVRRNGTALDPVTFLIEHHR